RTAINPGISCSANRISTRPNPANDKSATLKSPSARVRARDVDGCMVLVMDSPDLPTRDSGDDHSPYATPDSVRGGGSGPVAPTTAPHFPPVWFPRAWLGLASR